VVHVAQHFAAFIALWDVASSRPNCVRNLQQSISSVQLVIRTVAASSAQDPAEAAGYNRQTQ